MKHALPVLLDLKSPPLLGDRAIEHCECFIQHGYLAFETAETPMLILFAASEKRYRSSRAGHEISQFPVTLRRGLTIQLYNSGIRDAKTERLNKPAAHSVRKCDEMIIACRRTEQS
jgi:hypothetical protein